MVYNGWEQGDDVRLWTKAVQNRTYRLLIRMGYAFKAGMSPEASPKVYTPTCIFGMPGSPLHRKEW